MNIGVNYIRVVLLQAASKDVMAAAASNTSSAAGNNHLSRAEQATLPADLSDVVDIARSRKPGVAPTPGEIEVVLDEKLMASIAGVNQSTGNGRAYLSKAELQNLIARDPVMGARVQRAVDFINGV